jgi:hypothetical protein
MGHAIWLPKLPRGKDIKMPSEVLSRTLPFPPDTHVREDRRHSLGIEA